MGDSVPYPAGAAIAIHNADLLVRRDDGKLSLVADVSKVIFSQSAIGQTFLDNFEHRIDIKPTMDGLVGLQIGALFIASRNIVQVFLDQTRNEVHPSFASGSEIGISMDSNELDLLITQLRQVGHFCEIPRNPASPTKGVRFINSEAIVLLQDLSEQSNEPSFRLLMLNGDDVWLDELPQKLMPGSLGDSWISTPNQHLNLDYAWAIGRPEQNRYIQFNSVLNRESSFPSASPWGINRLWLPEMDTYLRRANRWLNVGDHWFNLSRVSSARIVEGELLLSNHPHNLQCKTTVEAVRGNPQIGNLLSVLEAH